LDALKGHYFQADVIDALETFKNKVRAMKTEMGLEISICENLISEIEEKNSLISPEHKTQLKNLSDYQAHHGLLEKKWTQLQYANYVSIGRKSCGLFFKRTQLEGKDPIQDKGKNHQHDTPDAKPPNAIEQIRIK
jgi:hypothetical protein